MRRPDAYHGTREAPQLIADLSCGLLRNREERVWVLLEYPTSDNAHLQRYMASQGTATDRETLLASRFWQPEHQDGRRSRAMLDMLESLRALAVQTGRLRVEAFDPGFDDAEKRDALMAQQVERLVTESKGAQILLLTGNIHNRKKPGVDWDKERVTMGSLIKRPYRSYLLRANRGAYWGRDQNGAGVKSLPTLASPMTITRDLAEATPFGDGYFDGVIAFDSFTASEPAISKLVSEKTELPLIFSERQP